MKHSLTIILLFVSFYSSAQNRNSIWCFGDSAGIDFRDTANPAPIFSGMDGRGSCVSIADTSGNLLFYAYTRATIPPPTTIVRDRNNNIMFNGTGIVGEGWYNELVIVPDPGNSDKYYLFTNGATETTYRGLYYSIIDMSQNSGLGSVVQKNIHLIDSTGYDIIAAVKHGNGRDWWVITRMTGLDFNNRFYKCLVTISSISVLSTQLIGDISMTNAGNFTFSSDGTFFIFSDFNGLVQKFNFDRCTGNISNPITIQPTQSNSSLTSCTAISPNDSVLYLTNSSNSTNFGYLIQFDLTASNISLTRDTISTFPYMSDPFILRKAPDNKIYISSAYWSPFNFNYPYPDSVRNYINMNLSVINWPNNLGVSCNLTPFSFYLNGKRTYYGLPNNPDYDMQSLTGSPCDTIIANISLTQNIQTEINIYPNPTEDYFFVESEIKKGQIEIYNIVGDKIYSEKIKSEPIYLNQPAGIYFVKVSDGEKVFTQKLVIE